MIQIIELPLALLGLFALICICLLLIGDDTAEKPYKHKNTIDDRRTN